MPTEPQVRRQFRVQKDNGEFWNMNFTNSGLNWERADQPFDLPLQNFGARPPMGGPMAAVQTLSAVAETAASIAMWWEMRQHRLHGEAMDDEAKRISWLADMIVRWGEAHQHGGHLDLRVSEYLARETAAAMDVIVSNKRVSLPQSTLYELETIQDVFRSFRALLLSQFETLSADTSIDLDRTIGSALPNSKLNLEFIRSLGADPAAAWATRVAAKSTGDFDRELNDGLRNPSWFLSRVFSTTELAVPIPVEERESKQPGLVERLISVLTPALPRIAVLDSRPDASDRRDAFRELSLLPAEVARVKALNSAWLAMNALVDSSSTNELQVQISDRGVATVIAPSVARAALER